MFGDGVIRILVVEDEEYDVYRIRNTLRFFESQIVIEEVVSNGDAALEVITRKKHEIDVVIMDLQIAGGVMGEALIRAIRGLSSSLQIIVVTKMTVNITDFEFANRLLKAGAFWYCTKYPSDIEEYIYQPTDFIISIFNAYQKRVLERQRTRSERTLLRHVEERLSRARILGVSEQTRKLRGHITQIAASNATVLISGPSGVGKELVATHIHFESSRKLENFIPINCGSIPADLIESELFGYEKGAFTGAANAKQGLFEIAHRGTIFLDEIGDLPLPAQVKLLRVIQEGEIEKIGRSDKKKVDVRIIAATNKNLRSEISEGRFREDLYYRLNVVPMYVAPLRDRPDDILTLWQHFLTQIGIDMGVTIPETDGEAEEILQAYPWPGNVRELKNVAQRILLVGSQRVTSQIVKEALSLDPQASAEHLRDALFFRTEKDIIPLRDMERLFRAKYFQFVRKFSTSDAEAARKLGLARSNFHRMSKELGMK